MDSSDLSINVVQNFLGLPMHCFTYFSQGMDACVKGHFLPVMNSKMEILNDGYALCNTVCSCKRSFAVFYLLCSRHVFFSKNIYLCSSSSLYPLGYCYAQFFTVFDSSNLFSGSSVILIQSLSLNRLRKWIRKKSLDSFLIDAQIWFYFSAKLSKYVFPASLMHLWL